MTISERTETFAGKAVRDYEGGSVDATPATVHRLALEYDDERSMGSLVEEYLSEVDKSELEALVIGMWSEPHDTGPADALDVLVQHAPELPKFKALFVGDMTYEECEISWIIQGDYEGVLKAFPQLEVLRIRGSTSLSVPPFSHDRLREFVIECGGLPSEIVESLENSKMPALERLELWLGADDYGFSGNVDLYRRVIPKLLTPTLRYLGLRDSQISDELAQWLAGEAWVASLETLDLSLGTIGDEGAKALLASPHMAKLKRLDLSHHYICTELQEQLRQAIPGVVLGDPQEPDDDYRYVAVGE